MPKWVGKIISNKELGTEKSRECNNDNKVVNFATTKNLTVKSAMIPHRNINKFT